MIDPLTVWLLFALILAYIWWYSSKKPSTFPPGPYCWPVVGNIVAFRSHKSPIEAVSALQREHGNVVGIHFGVKPVIVVSGLSEIREVLTRPEFQGRPRGAVRVYLNDVRGILLNQGEVWQEQRRFAMRHLRDLGVGKRELESFILEEVRDMLEDVSRMAGKDCNTPVPVMKIVSSTGANVIYHLLAGERFKRGEPQLENLLEVVRRMAEVNDASGGVLNSFPFLLKHARWMTNFDDYVQKRNVVKGFLKEMIEEHERNFNADQPADIVDFYLAEIKKDNPGSSFYKEQLLTVCYEMFLAGSDTTVGLLAYAVLQMVLNPTIQDKVYAELEAVVGRERLPSVDDKARLPYVCAVIQEALRMGNIAPLGVAHSAMEEVTFRGYVIPKGARIITNLYELHLDEHIWGDPQVFRPERFIDDSGKLINHEALLPFGMGKRVCLGESMARTNIFLTFTALLQKFELSVPEGEATPSLEQTGGIVLVPKPFNVKITPRA